MHIVPDLSICTATTDDDDSVVTLLSSVRDTADPVAVEGVVVINGGSQIFTGRLDSLFPEVKILENRGPVRLSRTRNQALRLATGRYLSFWDRDAAVLPGCLLQLVQFLDEHPETGIAVPCVEDSEGTVFPTFRSFPGLISMLYKYAGLACLFPKTSSRKGVATASGPQGKSIEIDWAIGSAMVVRREVLEEIGYFDERYLAAYDDADFCRRAKKAGWHVAYLPAARVLHNRPGRYDANLILDIDPLSPAASPRTHPEQLLDAVRFLLGGLRR